MKKIFLFASFSILGLSSCKKDWNCNCTSGDYTTTIESYSGFKKKDAKSKCDDVQKDFQVYDASVSCEIAKK